MPSSARTDGKPLRAITSVEIFATTTESGIRYAEWMSAGSGLKKHCKWIGTKYYYFGKECPLSWDKRRKISFLNHVFFYYIYFFYEDNTANETKKTAFLFANKAVRTSWYLHSSAYFAVQKYCQWLSLNSIFDFANWVSFFTISSKVTYVYLKIIPRSERTE
jgi:hypothetical protein